MRKFNYYNLFLLASSVLAVLIFIILVIAILNKPTDKSVFESLTPGRATIEDVKKLNGEPISSEKIGDKTYLYYPTHSEDYKNSVVVEKDRVKFSLENVFDSSKGFLNDYKKRFGNPDFTIYDSEDDVVAWNIFLKGGVGIASFGEGEIAKILYFEPQSKDEFLENVAASLGLTFQRPIHSDE